MKKGFEYYAELAAKIFPLLTALAVALGYMGFNTFIAIYHLPMHSPDISVIAGIGLINITYLGILYIVASQKRRPTYMEAFLIYAIFNFVLENPIFLAGIIALQFVLYSFEKEDKYKILSFSERRTKTIKYLRRLHRWEIAILILSVVFSLLFDFDLIVLILLIYMLLLVIHNFKRHKRIPNIYKGIYIILFPVVTMFYFINSSKTNIIGLNSEYANIITKTDTISTEIIYNDEKFLYTFSDSTKIVTTIKRDDIIKIINKSDKIDKSGLVKTFKVVPYIKSLFK